MTELNEKALEVAARKLADRLEKVTGGVFGHEGFVEDASAAISAYFSALPEQEPVAWWWKGPKGGFLADDKKPSWPAEPLFASPVAQPPRDGEIYAAVSKRQFSNEENAAIDQDIKAKLATLQPDQNKCEGADDPEERCPRHPRDCKCWQVDFNHPTMALQPDRAGSGDVVRVKADAFDRSVAARKKHVDAVAIYNARLAYQRSLPIEARFPLEPEYRTMSDAQSAFVRCAQDETDAALTTDADRPDTGKGGNHTPSSILGSIKPLEWRLNSEAQTLADVFFGRYIVERNTSDRWCWGLSFHGEQGVGLYHADNFEAAKVAVQADYQQRIMSAFEDHLSVSDVLETAARAGDAAVYEAMRSKTFDPSIPDNVAEFVGNAIRAASISSLSGVENAPQAPTSNHVNGGAYRKVSAEEWRALGGDDNKSCDWHEGIGYVVYDDLALEQYLAKTGAITPAPADRPDTGKCQDNDVAVGMAMAATIIMKVWGRQEYAREILGSAGILTEAKAREIGLEDYDIDALRPIFALDTGKEGE